MVSLCRALWDFMTILSAVALLISLYAQGILPIHWLIPALLLVPIALTVGGFGRFLVRIGLPILSLITLSITLGGGKNVTSIFGLLLQLAILLFAFYVMFRPLKKR